MHLPRQPQPSERCKFLLQFGLHGLALHDGYSDQS
ncbi:hypothetical protein [Sporisorium scitamineum]|uniref:Uncharacterized protein n=1 Tax=Sporisorium scitamineum TaxID=49012 RepID=A0A0F7SBB8_9BASI|nr:hypothetical protein [Sporisorium scitamineum]